MTDARPALSGSFNPLDPEKDLVILTWVMFMMHESNFCKLRDVLIRLMRARAA